MLSLQIQNQTTHEWETLKDWPKKNMADYNILYAEGDLITEVPSEYGCDAVGAKAPATVTLAFWAPEGEQIYDEAAGRTLTLFHEYGYPDEDIIPGYALSRIAFGNARLIED